jgi:hypothetical protein
LLRPSAAWLPGSALSLRVKPETRNIFLESHRKFLSKDSWRFLTVVKRKHGRRNRYYIQAHLPLPKPASREPAQQLTRLRSTTLARTDTGGPASAMAYREQSQERGAGSAVLIYDDMV